MTRFFASLLLAVALTAGASAQDAHFEGRVVQADTGEPLVGATVSLQGTVYGASTDVDGRYGFSAPAAAATLVASFVGYETERREVRPAAGATVREDFALAEGAAAIGDVVVTGASRRAERLTESPATVSVISGADLEALPGASYEQALATVKGVDFVRAGVSGFGINARGFNSAFNTKMLLLTDGRRQMLPGAGLPFANMNPVIKEDVDRVEVILGPSSALYGANAHNGIVNVVTKDPRNTPGLTVVAEGGGGGESSALYSARGRYAQGFAGNRLAVKLTGEYTGGDDFDFRDTVYVNVPGPTAEAADFDVEHLRGQAEVYASPVADTDVVLAYAGSRNDYLGVTNLGRNQIDGWTLHQLQARVVHPRVFAQVYRTWSNSGNTFALQNYAIFTETAGQDPETARQSARFVDKSRKTNAEVQGNVELYGLRLIAGGDVEWEKAVSEGTYLSDTTGVGLDFRQYGLSAQAEYDVTRQLRVVAAGRLDSQTNYGERFSPKLGLVFTPQPQNSFRITYGEAYVAPTVLQQEIFIPSGVVKGTTIPIVIRGNAGGFTTVNPDGTPGAGAAPIEPEEVRTLEVGYRGLPVPRLFVDVNAYRSRSENFISPLVALPGLVTAIGGRPLSQPEVVLTYQNFGQVTSYGADLGVTYFLNDRISVGGTYSFFEAFRGDASLDLDEDSPSFDLNGDGEVSPNEISLNTPGHKGSITLTARDFIRQGLTGSVTVRGVSEYSFVSGRHFASDVQEGERVILPTAGGPVAFNYNYGPLGGFVTTSVSAGYRFSPTFSLGASVTNLFGVEQREFVGAAPTPRFFTATLRADLPSFGR